MNIQTKTGQEVAEERKNAVLWKVNPFWEGIDIKLSRKRTTLLDDKKIVTNLKTGEAEGTTELSKVYEVDSERFLKVYTRSLMTFFDISKNAQKLFEFVLFEVSRIKMQDRIYLHPKDAERYHRATRGQGFSRPSFYRAKAELIDKELIAQADTPNIFYINPAVFWNGDRVKFITEMKKAPEIEALGEYDEDENLNFIEIEDPDEGKTMAQLMGEDE